ncbi:MAG: D-galactarate dehydratase [Desulfobacteraceae bacterium]|nr:MAG: D-galactarate dehydratase [Desulfobacteraceae bacterium]
MAFQAIIIHPRDNVAVALRDLKAGETLHLADGRTLTVLTDIPYSHKVALADRAIGQEIIKYGENIGHARTAIRIGEWIHTHNLEIKDAG